MSGVGALGNLGGIIFALVFRLETETGKACWRHMFSTECSLDFYFPLVQVRKAST